MRLQASSSHHDLGDLGTVAPIILHAYITDAALYHCGIALLRDVHCANLTLPYQFDMPGLRARQGLGLRVTRS